MQIALKKTLKKVAAVSTSLALAGVTVTGALAAGLEVLPAPFGSSPATNVVVYGAAGTDMAAVNDVVAGLGGTPVSGGTTYTLMGYSTADMTVDDFQTGERDDITVGTAVDSQLSAQLDETDNVGLTEFNVPIDLATDKDYDAHEIITLVVGSTNITTALDSGDEDFKDKTFLIVPSESFGYQVQFEENLDTNNNITSVSATDTITVPFLGKSLILTGATATSITAYAGDKVKLKVGDTVKAGDKTVRLEGVDDNGALVTVDGEGESINEADRERVNGVELYVDDVFNSDDDANDQALIIVQGASGQAIETYNDGDEFVDENEDHYLWEWNLAGLDSTGKGNITLGIAVHEDLDDPSDTFHKDIMDLGLLKSNRAYLMDGDYLCLPYRYACMVLEGLNGDLTWNDYSFEAGKTEDLDLDFSGSGTFTTDVDNARVLKMTASGVGDDKGFTVVDALEGANEDLSDTDTIWLYVNGSRAVDANVLQNNGTNVAVFYEDDDTSNPVRADLVSDGTLVDHGDTVYGNNGTVYFARFDNGDYNARMFLNITASATLGTTVQTTPIVFIMIGGLAGASNLTFDYNLATNLTSGFPFIGDADGDADSSDFTYGGLDITGFEDDVRKKDGVVVKDPEGNIDNDKISLSVPNDDEYKYWVRIAKPKTGAASVVASGGTAKAASLSMKDTELTTDAAALGKNVVAVGGPAVNKVTAQLLGLTFPTYGSGVAGLSEGKAMLEMKDLTGGKKALLVYGWEADDTRRAALVVKNPDAFKAQLKDKTSVTVTGTSLTVSGITVA